MKVEPRSAWTTRVNKAPVRHVDPYRAGYVIHHPGVPWSLVEEPHAEHLRRVRQIEETQVRSPERYSAIAYQAVVCGCGTLIEGRTVKRVNAANDPANLTHGSVLALLGIGESPTPQMLAGLLRAHRYLNAVPNPVPHNSIDDTACPGPTLTRWLKAGAPPPGDAPMDWTDRLELTPKAAELFGTRTKAVDELLVGIARDSRLARQAAARAEAYAAAAAEAGRPLTPTDLAAIRAEVDAALAAGLEVEVTVGAGS